MDIASLLGLIICFVMIIFGITFGKNGVDFGALINFLDAQSAIITFGGAFCAVMLCNKMPDFIAGVKSFTMIFKAPKDDAPSVITRIIELANTARKEGLLSLQEVEIEDPFMKKGVDLVVDGTDPELVRQIMETELDAVEGRHKQKIKFWQDVASMGPAWGMIGTLIGLINMLQNMSDAAAIGPAMAVALITTLYGSMLANWIATPTSTKLSAFNDIEMQVKSIVVEGLLSIQAGENPRVIEIKLKSFLSPKDQVTEDGAGGGEG